MKRLSTASSLLRLLPTSVPRGAPALVGVGALILAAAPAAAAPSGTLVLYTSQPNEDAQQTVDAFEEMHPDVTVEWFRDGTTKVMAKLRAEIAAGDPRPDVLLIADTVTMASLEEEGRLMPHPDADVAAYDAALMDEERHWFSTKLITTGIVSNAAAPMTPADYDDLLAPEAAGQIAMPSPLTSGAATIHMATLTGDESLGWSYYEGLAGQDALAEGGNGGAGVRVLVPARADDSGVPYYDERVAAKLEAVGVPCFGCTPGRGGANDPGAEKCEPVGPTSPRRRPGHGLVGGSSVFSSCIVNGRKPREA